MTPWETNFYFINYNQITPEMSCLDVVFGIITTLATALMAVFTVILARLNKKLAKIEQERHDEETKPKVEIEDIIIENLEIKADNEDELKAKVFYLCQCSHLILRNNGKVNASNIRIKLYDISIKRINEFRKSVGINKEEKINITPIIAKSKKKEELEILCKFLNEMIKRHGDLILTDGMEKIMEKGFDHYNEKSWKILRKEINLFAEMEIYDIVIYFKIFHSYITNDHFVKKIKKDEFTDYLNKYFTESHQDEAETDRLDTGQKS